MNISKRERKSEWVRQFRTIQWKTMCLGYSARSCQKCKFALDHFSIEWPFRDLFVCCFFFLSQYFVNSVQLLLFGYSFWWEVNVMYKKKKIIAFMPSRLLSKCSHFNNVIQFFLNPYHFGLSLRDQVDMSINNRKIKTN